jgi:exonuclease VII small subunit
MNKEVERLLKNVKILVSQNALEAEFEACAVDDREIVESIEDLNDYLEESMTYWEE